MGGQYYDNAFGFYVGIENYCGKGGYRHSKGLKDICVGLMYNGREEGGGYYSGLMRVDGQYLAATPLKISDNFDLDVDERERQIRGETSSQGANILISKARFPELCKKEKLLAEI